MKAKPAFNRVIIESVKPQVDGGRYPIKRILGEEIVVEADIFVDGHDVLGAELLFRKETEREWKAVPLIFINNDHWQGAFVVSEVGRYCYTVRGWIDPFKTWRKDLQKRLAADQDVSISLLMGAEIINDACAAVPEIAGKRLADWVETLKSDQHPEHKIRLALDDELAALMAMHPFGQSIVTWNRELIVIVDRKKACYSAWYEMFPRSCANGMKRHGTFKDCEARLSYIAKMGFDVLYLPPIHPIGHTHRKGKNNSPVAGPDDPGSPWAIGSHEGGHKAIHPRLGNLDDFGNMVLAAQKLGIEVALDIAFQCSPDHPYAHEHPEWFRRRPDGAIQYAENPPKKYEDIYPFDSETENWKELREELKSIVFFWIDQGIRIFRVDNPHTKPFSFWEWLIAEVKKDYPDVIFLAEAFTRPKIMYNLAKLGFSQSYTYFAWRNTKWEITKYFTELKETGVREFFRPSLWPNTPDILTEYLQIGGKAAFMSRLVLAATLGANYGIYGPAFELCENRPRERRSEEYLDSEKYEIKSWDIKNPLNIKDFIARVNKIRRENPALQSDWSLQFLSIDSDQLIAYCKHTEDFSNIIVVVVNLDPHHSHAGWLELPLSGWGLDLQRAYQVHDLLSDAHYLWHGNRGYVEINPQIVPAHIFRVRRHLRTEQDFDYFI